MTDNETPVDLEGRLAAKIRELREREGLTYRQLADRMKTVGCEISGPTIQKTEKAGRRVPADELVGYSRAFDMSLGELLGIPDEGQLAGVWQTYIGLERLANVLRHVRTEYGDALGEVLEIARQSPELTAQIRNRRDKYLGTLRHKAQQQAANDGEDVSTPAKLDAFMERWGYFDVPALSAAKDVLEEADSGEGE